MKRRHYISFLLVALGVFLSVPKGFSQITLTADSVECGATGDTLRATLIGDAPTSAGITADDGYSGVINIGFTYNFYGTNYTQLCIGSNGILNFNTSVAGGACNWYISAALAGNPTTYNCVCGPWCDIYIPAGGTITYSTVGTSPYRKFAATWCSTAMYSCTTQWTTTQIILYETTNLAEVHIAHKTICSWNGGYAIVGVQNAAGSASTAAPSRDYPTTWTATNEAWRFTPSSSATSYSVSSISFAPIPYASSTICWFDSSTGSFLGTGPFLYVTPTTPHTYYATAAGCADSTFAYIHVDLDSLGGGGNFVNISSETKIDPSECGRCNGVIKLHGVAPHQIDSVFYTYNGVPNPVYIDSAAADSTITIRNLCAGTYSNIYLKVLTCTSNVVADVLSTTPLVSSFTAREIPGCTHDTVITVSTSTPAGYSSAWSFGDGTAIDLSPVTATHAYSSQGTYTIKHVYSNPYGCVDSSTQTVSFNHPLSSVFTASAYTMCVGDVINFTNTSVGNGATYRWDFGNGATSTDQNPTYSYPASGEFAVKLTVTDTIPCSVVSVAKMEVISVTAKTDFVDTIVCLRNHMQLLGTATVNPPRFTNLVYAWSPATGLSDATVRDPYFFSVGDFNYSFTATLLPYGCSATAMQVIHSKPPIVLTNLTANQAIVLGESVQLNADSGWVYVWSPNDGTLDNPNINNPIATPVDSVTVYRVIGMSPFGCKDTAFVTIHADLSTGPVVATAFTPNFDGKNDIFRPYNLKTQKMVEMKIFNRWGKEVYSSSDANGGWDGTYNGEKLDIGVYYYYIILGQPNGTLKTFRGDVTLIR